eukprot:CAMPEP_0117692372 /NCGR_PEP_ID=MMETSP0804-20121206/26292_1 /TAXON_ID=1074897 /ORGANISM="Tetraselmis astigmatica, Strain CCMP880" /LENGTH=463 /DNA_ID=CAMNT_0005505815 /DNA_START=249 /DNA_END=1638 /DNA_ORIENTATION=+
MARQQHRAAPQEPSLRTAIHTSMARQIVFDIGGMCTSWACWGSGPFAHLSKEHKVPFGMALELVEMDQNGSKPEDCPVPGSSPLFDEAAYHLHFVTCGVGRLECAKSEGSLQTLVPGDSIVGTSRQPHGPVRLDALPGTDGTGGWGLVLLKVVFPVDMLSANATSLKPGCTVRGVTEQWQAGTPRGVLGSGMAQKLLAGAQEAAMRSLDSGSTSSATGRNGPPGGRLVEETFLDLGRRREQQSPGGLRRRHLLEVDTFQLPNQSNLLALVFDPLGEESLPFTFGVEVFQPDHRTPPHTHTSAYEVFFILSGSGEAFCNSERFPVCAGDTIVLPPGSLHGIDNGPHQKMYLLELMLPNDQFAEFVRQGEQRGLEDEDLCVLKDEAVAVLHTADTTAAPFYYRTSCTVHTGLSSTATAPMPRMFWVTDPSPDGHSSPGEIPLLAGEAHVSLPLDPEMTTFLDQAA